MPRVHISPVLISLCLLETILWFTFCLSATSAVSVGSTQPVQVFIQNQQQIFNLIDLASNDVEPPIDLTPYSKADIFLQEHNAADLERRKEAVIETSTNELKNKVRKSLRITEEAIGSQTNNKKSGSSNSDSNGHL